MEERYFRGAKGDTYLLHDAKVFFMESRRLALRIVGFFANNRCLLLVRCFLFPIGDAFIFLLLEKRFMERTRC